MTSNSNRTLSTQALISIVAFLSLLLACLHLRSLDWEPKSRNKSESIPSANGTLIIPAPIPVLEVDPDDPAPGTKNKNPLLTKQGVNEFIIENLEASADFPIDFAGIDNLCSNTQWQADVYFVCVRNTSGLMHAYNTALNCLRYAIAAGATGLVIPKIEKRNPNDLKDLRSGRYESFDYFFDSQWFRNVMIATCERMRLYDEVDDITNAGAATITEPLSMKKLMGKKDYSGWRNKNTNGFRDKFDQWIKKFDNPPSGETPMIVRLDDKMVYSFPPSADDSSIADRFGFMLNFRLDLVAVSNLIVERLTQASISHIVDATERRGESSSNKNTQFMGVHLRTEADAPDSWPKADAIGARALEMAIESGNKLIYVATGDDEGFEQLSAKAQNHGMLVVDKWRMLTANEKEFLKQFEFDQLGIVDFLVLLKADRFLGSAESGYSTNLVLRREFLFNETRWDGENNKRNELIGLKQFEFLDMMWP